MRRLTLPLILASGLLSGCNSTTTEVNSNDVNVDTKPTAYFDSFSYQGETEEKVTVAAHQYQNPILSGYYPDPSLTRVGDDYYLVNSSFTNFPGLPIFHSKDLVNWTQISNAIDRPSQLDFSGRRASHGVFAPDISFHDGLFYIITTCVYCEGNFVITAEDPAGPWSEPTWLPFGGIDPSIYWEGDKAYVVNNDAPNETPRYEGHRAIWVQEFDWKNKQMVGERTQLINGGVDISQKPIWIEGPHLFKRGEYYYITAAEGGTSVQHSQTIFRSKNIRGPFVPAEQNPILTQRDLNPTRANPITSAGHAKFVTLPNGDWWATFLATRPYAGNYYNIGRETFLLPVSWKDGWPHILPQGEQIPYVHNKPALPEQPAPSLLTSGNFGYHENFDANALGLEWIGYRTPDQTFYHMKKGQLALECGEGFGDTSLTPHFVGRRQQHHIVDASLTLNDATLQPGMRAGMALVQNDQSRLFFGVLRNDDEWILQLSSHDTTDEEQVLASLPIQLDAPISLNYEARSEVLHFTYSQHGQTEVVKTGVEAKILSTDRATGFVGALIGAYCAAE